MNKKSKAQVRHSILALLLLTAIGAGGQPYTFRTALRDVPAAGFYKVMITPAISAYTTPDSRDLRIADAADGEVPYLYGDNLPLRQGGFHPFAIAGRSKGADGHTHLLLRNDAPRAINELLVKVRNTAAIRTASVSGSDDGATFFSLRDSVMLHATSDDDGDTAYCVVQLPRTTYPFLQLTIFDEGLLPLDVAAAGIYTDSTLGAQYTAVPPPSLRQKDSSDHRSYIFLHADMPYRIDRMTFVFGGPRFYKRTATLYSGGMEVAHFTATHLMPATAWVRLHHVSDAVLVVDNEDAPPLRLQAVHTAQLQEYLLAYLEPGKEYVLRFGDTALPAPVYDLRYFKDSISQMTPPELWPGNAITKVQTAAPEIRKPFIGTGILWIIIGAVLIGLLAATAGMMWRIKDKAE